jgi:hypothetical protein
LAEFRKTGVSNWLSRKLPFNIHMVTKIEAERKWRQLRKKIADDNQPKKSASAASHSSRSSSRSPEAAAAAEAAAYSVSSPKHIMRFMDGKRKGEIVKIKRQR